MEAFHPAFFAQQAGLILPSVIMMLKNDEDRQFVTELYLQYRELMYVVARRYFGDKEMDIEDAISIAVERMCRYIDSFRGILCKEPAVKYAVIEKAAGKLSVNRACKLMKVRRQGYYEYLSGRDSARKTEDRQLTAKIKNIFYESNRVYGARKILEELRNGGVRVSRKRVRRLMDAAGLVAVTWRRSVHTTVSDPKANPFPNLLKQDFRVALPNHTWVSDFTYVPTDEGWLYLCTFIDLFSRRVVGWAVSNTIDRHLAIAAFRNAVANRHPGQRLVIHTDRGCQYTSWDFRREVTSIGGIQSMSRPGMPYDNACAETFFKTIKVECIDNVHFKTREEASGTISRYLLFYNRLRIHQSLGYFSPVEFERLFAA